MMSLYELFIGFRYLKAKKSQGFISFNTVLSIATVSIGVFILIIVISVMNGFQSQIKDKILDVDAHITVSSYFSSSTRGGIRNYIPLKEKLETVEGIRSVDPFIQSQALLRFGEDIFPVAIRGIGSENHIPANLGKFITEGEKKFTGPKSIFIGSEMAFNYNIKLGDRIELIVPKGRLTVSTGVTPGKEVFRVTGFFKTHYYEFDTGLIVMSLKSAQRLYDIGDVVWGLGAKVDDLYKMDQLASQVQAIVGYEYQVLTAEQRNKNFFYALRLEKLIMTIILFLVIISAGFTIMGTLVMVVMEKRRAIGILKSMGAKNLSIMMIFIMEGFLIGIVGSIIGVVLGLAASINLEAIIEWVEAAINNIMTFVYDLFNLGIFYNISLVPKHVYYLDSIPTEISVEFVVSIAIVTVFLSTVAAIFPSWHASRLQPVETIRHE